MISVKEILRYFMLAIVFVDSFMLYESFAALKSLTQFNRNTLAEERLLSDLKDAESGQRAFLYTTGNEDYLPQYYSGVSSVHSDLAMLRQYLGKTPEAEPVLDQLDKDVAIKLNELDTTIKEFRSGDAKEAKAIVTTGKGLRYMVQITSDVSLLREQERDRLHYRGLMPQ